MWKRFDSQLEIVPEENVSRGDHQPQLGFSSLVIDIRVFNDVGLSKFGVSDLLFII